MTLSKDDIRVMLTEYDLRGTAPRLAVVTVLDRATKPLSHSEVLNVLGEIDWDPATIFRNLIKLREAGVALVVSRIDGIDRYILKTKQNDMHHHPHFSCDDCGELTCLPGDVTTAAGLEGPWIQAVQRASVQFRGQCPNCV